MGTTHRSEIYYDDYDIRDIDNDREKRRKHKKSEQCIYDNTFYLNHFKAELEKVNRERRKI